MKQCTLSYVTKLASDAS